MEDLLSKRPWDEASDGFYLLKILPESQQFEREWFVAFWKKVVSDVLPAIVDFPWDRIECTLRPEDGHISFYFSNSQSPGSGPPVHLCLSVPSFRVNAERRWAEEENGAITGSVRHAQDLADTEMYAKALAVAAQSISLDRACGSKEPGLKIRFHHYDDEPPIYETVLRTQEPA
jgi:hypothetical protein